MPVHRSGIVRRLQQRQRIKSESASQALHSTQRQVALTPLHATEVGPMHAKTLGERLLAVTVPLTMAAQVHPDISLQLTFHHRHVLGTLLISLHTYE
jgi:hypothetical protein